VNSAHSGDTIIVEPGNYVGNIDISIFDDLNNLVLMSASGDPANTVIIADNSVTDIKGVISILKYKNNVKVKGFTISGARDNLAGVYLENGEQCTIENNIFMNDGIGVSVSQGSGNVISNNTVNRTKAVAPGTPYTGINIDNSANTVVSSNSVSNQDKGIHIGSGSKGSSISENFVNNNAEHGILLENSRGITVKGNTLNSNSYTGIYLSSSSENKVTYNTVVMPGPVVNNINTNAIQLYSETRSDTNSNEVSYNTVSLADHGIFLNGCKSNTIQNNRAFSNNYGIAMRYSHNNRVINNNANDNQMGNGEGLYFTFEDSGNIISGNSANKCLIGIHLSQDCGINNLVDNNTVNSNQYNGIYVEAQSNTISNNFASDNSRGIFLIGSKCKNNTISSNTVTKCVNGIYLQNTSDKNKLVSNILISNNENGIQLFNSNYSYLGSNRAEDNKYGIQVINSSEITVNNNTALKNTQLGIRLLNSNNNTLTKNNATNHEAGVGIVLNSAVNNTLNGNYITRNDKGISMCPACRKNVVYDNYFYNNVNTDVGNTDNTWYIARTPGKNIMSGPYIGGNFWASPGGDGFSQTAPDTNGDEFADNAPYTFTNTYDGNIITITDGLPLVSVVLPVADFSINPAQGTAPLTVQFKDLSQNADSISWDLGDGNNSIERNLEHTYSTVGTYYVKLTVSNKNNIDSKNATVTVQAYVAPPITPVADFSANPTSGTAPLIVQFTDSSQNAAGVSWDFGDGSNSNEKNPVHVFQVAGTYTVNMIASNANGSAPKTAAIAVQAPEEPHHSSGGGGGGGGSPEPQSNVQVKELSQAFISSGKSVKFDFPQKVTPVVYVSFDSKKTVGKTTTIVEMLKAKSTLVSGLPSGEVYKSLNIWVGNSGFATSKNIENAVVGFKVEKSWIQDKKIDKSSLTLNRYSDKTWNQLPTSLSSEDDTYLYLTAQTTGFSPFAITGKITAAGTIQPAVDKTQPAANVTQSNTNTGSTAANTEKTPEKKESPSPSQKKSPGMPGFELVCGIAGLLAVFLYRRK
jgi:PGF-pre-PGF domain-containing protein